MKANIDRLEKSSCEAIFTQLEQLHQESYSAVPSLGELCARYGDREGRKVYMTSRDVEGRWLDLHTRGNGVKPPID